MAAARHPESQPHVDDRKQLSRRTSRPNALAPSPCKCLDRGFQAAPLAQKPSLVPAHGLPPASRFTAATYTCWYPPPLPSPPPNLLSPISASILGL